MSAHKSHRPAEKQPFEWLIIGGGIHGTHIAARLIGEAGFTPQSIAIVDPSERLLNRWRTCTHITGMTHLRSPSVHNLGLSPWSLKRFVGKAKKRKPGLFVQPYDRPALSLFNAHADQVVEAFGLADHHIVDRAENISIEGEELRVQLAKGRNLLARKLVLAMGTSDHPHWPDWAFRDHERIHHVFEPGFEGWPTKKESVVVVGGGISAGQIALRLIDEGHQVHLVSRHALRQHQFDSDPGWLGPRFMTGFHREPDLDRRRAMISEARHRGSVPPDVRRTLRYAIKRKLLSWHEAEVKRLDSWSGGLFIDLSNNQVIDADRVLLATGFSSERPGGQMIDDLIKSAALPCASCGFPIVDTELRWHPKIHVSGPLAELELGPASRNISGARRAADRLVAASLQPAGAR